VWRVTLSDITEQKQAQDSLRASEARLRALLTNAPVVLFAIDGAGIVTFADGRGLAGMGFAPEEGTGQRLRRRLIVPPLLKTPEQEPPRAPPVAYEHEPFGHQDGAAADLGPGQPGSVTVDGEGAEEGDDRQEQTEREAPVAHMPEDPIAGTGRRLQPLPRNRSSLGMPDERAQRPRGESRKARHK